MKTLTESIGKNFNNRVEESLGSVTDLNVMVRAYYNSEVVPTLFEYEFLK